MSDDAKAWLQYANENLQVSAFCIESGLYNPSIHNAQQAVEKSLKAMCLVAGLKLRKTHSISSMVQELRAIALRPDLTDEECDLMDSVYLPSKYPLDSVLPDYEPDEMLTKQCYEIAQRVNVQAKRMVTAQ